MAERPDLEAIRADLAETQAEWDRTPNPEKRAILASIIADMYLRDMMPALLAYIAVLEPIVRAVAAHDSIVAWGSEWQSICGLCEGHAALDDARLITDDTIIHAPDCPVIRARALNIPPTPPNH